MSEKEWISSVLILLANISSIASSIYSFTIPWIRAYVIINEGFYRLSIPLEIGLLKCFSTICHDFQSLDIASISSISSTNFNDRDDPSNNSSDSIHIPHPKPPIVIQPPDIKRLIRQSVHNIEKPFKSASYATITMFAIMLSLCFLSILLSVYCLIRYRRLGYRRQLTLLLLSLFFQTMGVLVYISITISHINGGEYLMGVWLITYTTMICTMSAMIASVIYDRNKSKSYNYMVIHDTIDIEMEGLVTREMISDGTSRSVYGSTIDNNRKPSAPPL